MKIAIASDDGKTIASHFGRTRGFLIYEIEGETLKDSIYNRNEFTGHARGEHHHDHAHRHNHSAILQALQGCTAVISRGMGNRVYNDLKQAGIKAYIVNEESAEQALELYLNDQLQDNPDKGCTH